MFTFSVHCEKNFPLRKQTSDLDVGLPCGINDRQYIYTVADYLPWLLDSFRPDLVLYDAGVDPHQDDVLGKLSLTDQGTLFSFLIQGLCPPVFGDFFTTISCQSSSFSLDHPQRSRAVLR